MQRPAAFARPLAVVRPPGDGRLIFDELEAAIDPNAARSFRMIEQRARREYGQRFWWRPGTPAPQRAPNLGAATGGS